MTQAQCNLVGKLYSRQPSLQASTTASPMSGQMWADVCDSEDDVSEMSEECMLPPVFCAASEPGSPPRTTPHETVDGAAGHEARASALNPYAAEFLPTLSMNCTVVGYCNVIAEGDEAQEHSEEVAPSDLLFLPAHCAAPLPGPGVESRPAVSSKKRFWREGRPAALQAPPRPSRAAPAVKGLHEGADVQRRLRTIAVIKESKEYQCHLERRRLCGPDDEPLTPDAADAALSKRAFEREVRIWRGELRKRGECRPEAASVASTEAEEAQLSEADDATTAHSDDASSAHGSFR